MTNMPVLSLLTSTSPYFKQIHSISSQLIFAHHVLMLLSKNIHRKLTQSKDLFGTISL